MPRKAIKTTKKTTKSNRKKPTESTPKTLRWKQFDWHSKGRNWNAEYRKRLERDIYDPFINPHTGCYYTVAAQNYREPHLVLKPGASPDANTTHHETEY